MKKFIFISCFLLANILQAQNLFDVVSPSGIKSFVKRKPIFCDMTYPHEDELLLKLLTASVDDVELNTYLKMHGPSKAITAATKNKYPKVKYFLSHLCDDDVDNDGDRDIVYEMRDPDVERQLIRVFVNEGGHYRSIRVPGFLIREFEIRNGISWVKTVEFGCCDFEYDIYRKIRFNGYGEGAMTLDYSVAVPKRTEVYYDVRGREEIMITGDSVILRTVKKPQLYARPIYLRKGQAAKLIAEDATVEQYLIAIPYTDLMEGVSEVWGWVDRKDVEVKSGKLKAEGVK